MSVFAIADLHLSHSTNKPMDIFGARWENHTEKIRENWLRTVTENDTVVIAGDISWGTYIEEAEEDFRFLESLPGRKIILKGNHDYWWLTMKKLQEFKERLGLHTVEFLYNNAILAEDYIICGTRGWMLENVYTDEDTKIVQREAGRLQMSLQEGRKLQETFPEKEILVFLHFPPAYGNQRSQPIIRVLAENKIKRIYYGHMHNADASRLIPQIAGATSELIAADWLQFCPVKI